MTVGERRALQTAIVRRRNGIVFAIVGLATNGITSRYGAYVVSSLPSTKERP